MKILVFKLDKLIKEYEITAESFVLGRSEDCDICLLEDNISRKHIEFKLLDNETLAFSKKSKFGEILQNGEAKEEGEISKGENLEIGDIVIRFSDDELEIEPGAVSDEDLDSFTMFKEDKEKPEVEEEGEKEVEIGVEGETEVPEEEEEVEGEVKVPEEEPPIIGVSDLTIAGPSLLLYQLTAISGPYKDKVFTLEKDSITVGRTSGTDIVLVDDMVSKEHARFYKEGVDYFVTDLKSANGVKVNGKRITEPTMLVSNDIIEIGSSTLRYMVIKPQVQGAQEFPELARVKPSRPGVEKIVEPPSETQMRKIEESYGIEEKEGEGLRKPLKLVGLLILISVILFLVLRGERKEPEEVKPVEQKVEEEVEEEIEKPPCLEEFLCHLPLGVQRQLLAEYDVGIRLLKNFQFELAEDRAKQILVKAPDWRKAQELLEVAGKQKERLLIEKKAEEDAVIRKMLEEKIASKLKEARDLMRAKRYEKVKEPISEVFEIDPNNEEAKKIIDQIEEIYERRGKLAKRRARFLASVSKYQSIFNKANRYLEKKEHARAIETFQRCINLPLLKSSQVQRIREESRRLMDESKRLLQEAVTPELAVADELFASGQYREAIASYKRVLKIDYKSKTAKIGIKQAKQSLNDEARDRYSRAAVAESVSDFKQACLLYNSVIQIALPGTRYYRESMKKVRKYCGQR